MRGGSWSQAARGGWQRSAGVAISLADKRLASAQEIWCEYAPRLGKLHLLSTLDRYTFAILSLRGRIRAANRDILDKGFFVDGRPFSVAKIAAYMRVPVPTPTTAS